MSFPLSLLFTYLLHSAAILNYRRSPLSYSRQVILLTDGQVENPDAVIQLVKNQAGIYHIYE